MLRWARRWTLALGLLGLVVSPRHTAAQVRASELESDESLPPGPALPSSAAVAPIVVPVSDSQRLILLNQEIEALDEEMPGVGGAIAVTLGGFAYSLAGFLAAFVLSSDGQEDSLTLGLYISSAASVAVGTGGAVWWAVQNRKREPYVEKVEALENERDRITWKLESETGGLRGSLTFAF